MMWQESRAAARSRCLAAAMLATGVLLAGACAGSDGSIRKAAGASRTTTTTSRATVRHATTTIAPTTVAPTTVATTVPAPPPPPTPEHTGDGDTATGPPPEVVRPPAAWIGFGVPQPGSMFENLQADHSLDGKGQFVALTFDDGPSQYTKPIVDILRFMGVQATFFQITNQSITRPDMVKEMVAAGMHLGAHTEGHKRLREISPDEQNEQVAGSLDTLRGLVGDDVVKCFRPPYAQYDQHVIDLVTARHAAMAMWSLDTLDWKKPAWDQLAVRVINGAKDRMVILMHDGGGDRTATIAALPWIIQGLRDRGFQFLPIC